MSQDDEGRYVHRGEEHGIWYRYQLEDIGQAYKNDFETANRSGNSME